MKILANTIPEGYRKGNARLEEDASSNEHFGEGKLQSHQLHEVTEMQCKVDYYIRERVRKAQGDAR